MLSIKPTLLLSFSLVTSLNVPWLDPVPLTVGYVVSGSVSSLCKESTCCVPYKLMSVSFLTMILCGEFSED